MGLPSFPGPFKCGNHPSTTSRGNWVAGAHVKAELGQAQSVLRPSGAGAHPRQSQRASRSPPRCRGAGPALPGRQVNGHRPGPALHRLTGCHSAASKATVSWQSKPQTCALPAPALASSSSPECGGSWCLGDGFREAGLGGLSGGWRGDTGPSPLGRYQRS